jgi:hypothetical protein
MTGAVMVTVFESVEQVVEQSFVLRNLLWGHLLARKKIVQSMALALSAWLRILRLQDRIIISPTCH